MTHSGSRAPERVRRGDKGPLIDATESFCMNSEAGPISRVWSFQVWGILACFAALSTTGCGRSSPDQRLAVQLKAANATKGDVFPLAGRILVDGEPAHTASLSQRILVVLFDPAKPSLAVNQRPIAECNPQGEFAFTTYGDADGVAPGKYVVAFAELPVESREAPTAGASTN